jgi:hypothetical protein
MLDNLILWLQVNRNATVVGLGISSIWMLPYLRGWWDSGPQVQEVMASTAFYLLLIILVVISFYGSFAAKRTDSKK